MIPEDAHPLDSKGWGGLAPVNLDGMNWPLSTAAQLLGIDEKDLRDLVRITGLGPSGTAQMRSYRSQGRAARVYPAQSLIMITEAVAKLREELRGLLFSRNG